VRIETKRLLDRLGQPDFQYREYGDAQPDHVERWPLFELVSRQLRPNRAYGVQGAEQSQEPRSADDAANSIQSLASRISIGLGR
jgi:hypothetical protein